MKPKNLLFAAALFILVNMAGEEGIYAQSWLWSLTGSGGAGGYGSAFKINENGTGYARAYDFSVVTPGSTPYYTNLCRSASGKLYGMTSAGGAYGQGIIFSYDATTNKYTDLMDFNGTNGSTPYGSLIQASNGKLYGMTFSGGASGAGLIFSFDTSASNPTPFTDLLDFNFTNGFYPQSSLMQAANGKLYGMLSYGGADGEGFIFSFDTSTANPTPLSDLLDFNGANGAYPQGNLIQAANGRLYGMTNGGGLNGDGIVFSFDTASANPSPLTDLLDFDNATYGGSPQGDLMQAANGKLYGMTKEGGNGYGLIFSFDTTTTNPTPFTDVLDFDLTNGDEPWGNLIQASNGKLYGMTAFGGANGSGVLFSYDTNVLNPHPYSDLVDFDYTHGGYSYSSLVQATDGKLYGMTQAGGVFGSGVLFSFNTTGNIYTDLVDLNGTNNGANPQGSMVQTASGRVYGMTQNGGNYNEGVIFSIDSTAGSFNKLFDFNGANGANPYGSLISATNGKLYGMTEAGGTDGYGVLFSYDPAENTYSTLHSFNNSDGANPYGGLVQAESGKLYGMTSAGGAYGDGVIFSYDPVANMYSKLYSFNNTNGAAPYGNLMQAASGYLYGMASAGGANGYGVLFSFDTTSSNPSPYADLFDFNYTSGAIPFGGLMQATNGGLYGMTQQGGANSYGVVFSFDTTSTNPTPYTDLFDFDYTHGAGPEGSLAQAFNGKLFGMTQQGGADGGGVIFSFTLPSTLTKVRDLNSPDGISPAYSIFMQFNPIATGAVASTLCAGTVVGVPYTAAASVFNNGNVFTAQLSDSTGSFASPVKIGTIISRSSATISATIPANTAAGSGYRIRVISSNPAVTGSYNGSNITIYPIPTGTVTPSPDVICSAVRTGITLTPGSIPGTTFTWTYSAPGTVTGTGSSCSSDCGTLINDSLYNNGTINAAVTYSITPRANGCAGVVMKDVVTLRPVPVAGTNSGTYSICGGTRTEIILTSTTGGTTYTWAPSVTTLPDNGLILDTLSGFGSTIHQLLVNTGTTNGEIVYTITPTYYGCKGVAASCTVIVKPGPNGSATPSPVVICSGLRTGITLVPGTVEGTSFAWTYSISGSIEGILTACASDCGTSINDSLYNTGVHDAKVIYTINTYANGCAGAAFKEAVTVRPVAKSYTPNPDTSVCSGAKISIPITSTSGLISLSYNSSVTAEPENGTITGFTSATIGARSTIVQSLINTGILPGVVTYIVTPSYYGCQGIPIAVSVSVNPVANGTATPASEDIIPGTRMNATLDTGTITGTTFTWTYKNNPYITGSPSICSTPGGACGTSITDSLYNTVYANENLTYTITPWAFGCAGTKFTHIVTVKPIPTVTTEANYITCSGVKTRILFASTTRGTQFSYTADLALIPDNGTVTGFNDGTSSPITQILINTGTTIGKVVYTITPDYLGSIGKSIYDTVTVNPVALGSCSPSVVGICGNGVESTGITLNPSVAGLNTYFTWSANKNIYISGPSTCSSNCLPTINDHLTTYVSSAVEVYTITPWTAGCAGTRFTATVTVQEGTPYNPGIAGTTTTICPLQSYTYTVTNLATFNTVHWKVPAGCSVVGGEYVGGPDSMQSNPITISYPSGFLADTIKASATNLCGNSSALVYLKVSTKGSICRLSGAGPESLNTMNILVYPNPTHDMLNMEFNSNSTSNCLITLIDITGRIVIERRITAEEGENHLEFDLGGLAKGIYLMSLASGNESKQARIVVE